MFEESENIRLIRLIRVSLCLGGSEDIRLIRLIRLIRVSLC